MSTTTTAEAADERRRALASVLSSRTFDRSEQLRSFLSFICELELAGKAAEISEYRIGVEALGRPPSWSPGEDATVRNRAFGLRKKLEEYYASEGRDEVLGIELPKGSYAPRFVARREESPREEMPPVPAQAKNRYVGWVAAFCAGVMVGAMVLWIAVRPGTRASDAAPVMKRAWGALLRPGAVVRLVVATPPSMFIRPYPTPNPGVPSLYPLSPEIEAWVRSHRRQDASAVLLQLPTLNSPLWGDVAGAYRIGKVLTGAGIDHHLVAERLLSSPALRQENVIFFGIPEYSPAIARLMEKLPFQDQYLQERQDQVIYERHPDGSVGRVFAPVRTKEGGYSEVYGLLTFLASDGDTEGTRRYVIVSGISSAGTEAAAEFLCSPALLAEMEKRLNGLWPRSMQIVVRAKTDMVIALGSEYAAHRVLDGAGN